MRNTPGDQYPDYVMPQIQIEKEDAWFEISSDSPNFILDFGVGNRGCHFHNYVNDWRLTVSCSL